MKSYIYSIFFLIGALAVSCEYDNYDSPDAQLHGNLVYQGEALGLSTGEVSFQLYEPGWQLKEPIYVRVAQDGSYSALIFSGNYQLIIPQNQGPFRNIFNTATNSDTLLVALKGNTTLNIEVMPYYMVRDAQFSASGGQITATFEAEKIITDANGRNIESVILLINKSDLVDGRADYNIASASRNGADITDPASISLTLTVPAIQPAQNYVFARVGIKIDGVEKMIFSPVQKITL